MSSSSEFLVRTNAWLAEHAPNFVETRGNALTPFSAVDEAEERRLVAAARAWQRHKFEHGWAGLAVPTEFGGRGGARLEQALFQRAEGQYRLPTQIYDISLGIVVPTLVTCAPQLTAAVRQILNGERLWCQLFSEPGAGSDLAAVATRAERTDDGWLVSGQKVWTSEAYFADFGYLLARTSDGPRHRNLSAFVLDMRAPGVTVRRVRQITGGATFNEVFLDAVHVPDSALIGSIGAGWSVAITTLMNERLAIGAEMLPADALLTTAADRGLLEEFHLRERVGNVLVHHRVLEQLREQVFVALERGETPGPEGSASKLFLSQAMALAAEVASEISGRQGVHYDEWTEFALSTLGTRIAGGTDEILKNVIAERVLGLPREPAAVGGDGR